MLVLVPTALLSAQTPKMSEAECTVWKREASFAHSVDAHDLKAFAAHVHPGAVFNAGSDAPTRGRDAVVKDWTPIVEGKEFALRWRPRFVEIGGDPNIAVSSGPFVAEDLRAEAKVKYRIGTFRSVWVRNPSDGQWYVLFDGAADAGKPVDTAEAAKKHLDAAGNGCH